MADEKFEFLKGMPLVERIVQRNISPTIVIGLGGTGKEVVLRLRHRVVQRYGRLDSLPCVRYLYLDTDTTPQTQQLYDLKSEDDRLYSLVRVQRSERVELNVNIPSYLERFKNNPSAHRYITEWFEDQGHLSKLDISKGAGQIRMASRLAFFNKIGEVEGRLNGVMKELFTPEIAQKIDKMGFDYDANNLVIYVVASTAGGTGSGTFIDMGFLLRKVLRDRSYQANGVLVMPGAFSNYSGYTRMQSNTYACLKELNHYSYGNYFQVDWSGHDPMALMPPPYHIIYMMDNQNEQHVALSRQGDEYDLYSMIGDTIFYDFSQSAFSSQKRSRSVNVEQFVNNAIVTNYVDHLGNASHRQIFPTRFGSFGFGILEIPIDNIYNTCASRLAISIIGSWGEAQTLKRNEVIEKFLRPLGLLQLDTQIPGGVVESADQIEDFLIKEIGVIERLGQIAARIEDEPVGTKAEAMREEIQNLDSFLKEDKDYKGEWIRKLLENKDELWNRAIKDIEGMFNSWINDPNKGYSYIKGVMKGVEELFKEDSPQYRYIPYFKRQMAEIGELSEERNFVNDKIIDLDAHENDNFIFRGSLLKHDYEELFDSEEPEGTVLYDYYYNRLNKVIFRECINFCELLLQYFKDKKDEYFFVSENLSRLYGSFREKEDFFKILNRKKRGYIESVCEDNEQFLEQWYTKWTEKLDVKDASDNIIRQIFGVTSLKETLDLLGRMTVDESEYKIFSYCRSYFVNHEKQPHILDLMFEKTDQQKRINQMRRILETASIWLKKSDQIDSYYKISRIDNSVFYIGIDRNHRYYSSFKHDLGKILPQNINPNDYEMGHEGRFKILFYSEIDGIPAAYPSVVLNLKSQYNQFYSNRDNLETKEDLHTDKRRWLFGDIMPKSPAERLAFDKALKAFLLGRMLGIFEFDEKSGNYGYYEESFLRHELISLGNEHLILSNLFHKTEHTDNIIKEIDERITTLQTNFLMVYLMLLMNYYLQVIYPRKQVESGVFIVSEEFRIIDELFQLYWRQIPDIEKFKEEYMNLTRGNSSLTHEDYEEILKPVCKSYGEMPSPVTLLDRVGLSHSINYKLLGLDFENLIRDKQEKPTEIFDEIFQPVNAKTTTNDIVLEYKKSASIRTKPSSLPNHPCPFCGEEIKVKAIICKNCKERLPLTDCPSCGKKIRADLFSCWNCQAALEVCPRCSKIIIKDNWPCRHCGYNPSVKEEAPIKEEKVEKAEIIIEECPFCFEEKPKDLWPCPHCHSMSPENASPPEQYKNESFNSATESSNSKPADYTFQTSENEQTFLNQCPVCRASVPPGAESCNECGHNFSE